MRRTIWGHVNLARQIQESRLCLSREVADLQQPGCLFWSVVVPSKQSGLQDWPRVSVWEAGSRGRDDVVEQESVFKMGASGCHGILEKDATVWSQRWRSSQREEVMSWVWSQLFAPTSHPHPWLSTTVRPLAFIPRLSQWRGCRWILTTHTISLALLETWWMWSWCFKCICAEKYVYVNCFMISQSLANLRSIGIVYFSI